jgi:acetyl-CoA acetyltransferase
VVSKPSSAYGTDSKMYDSSFGWRFVNQNGYYVRLQKEYKNSRKFSEEMFREDQDTFAFNSQMKATAAQNSGRLAKENYSCRNSTKKGDPIVFC